MGPDRSSLFLATIILLQVLSSVPSAYAAVSAAAVISATGHIIGASVTALGDNGNNRNIVIEITNHLEAPLYGGNIFLQWGGSKIPPPTVIPKMSMQVMQFQKVSLGTSGVSGILSYTIDDDKDPASFAIIFSVPFNYIHSTNWYGLTFLGKSVAMTRELYFELYNDPAWAEPEVGKKFGYANEGRTIVIFKNDYIISASMSNFGRSVMKVDVQKRTGGHERHHHKFIGK